VLAHVLAVDLWAFILNARVLFSDEQMEAGHACTLSLSLRIEVGRDPAGRDTTNGPMDSLHTWLGKEVDSVMNPLINALDHPHSVLATRWAGKTVHVTMQDNEAFEGTIVDADSVGIFLDVLTGGGLSREMFIPHRIIRAITLAM
jgi:hypothetical protein